MFTATSANLSRALSLVLASAEVKGTMPVLAYVLFEAKDGLLKLTATDIDSTIETQIETVECGDDFAWCVPGKPLYDLVRLLTADVTLLEFKGRIAVRSGDAQHLLPMLPAEHFPAIEAAQTVIGDLDGVLLSKMLSTAMLGAETNPNGVDWQKNVEVIGKDGQLTITGCSSAQISSVAAKFNGEVEAVIPQRAATILAAFAAGNESVSIACSNNLLTLRSETGAAHSRLSALRMADWRMLIQSDYQHSIELNPEAALPALRRALLASGSGAVNIRLGNGQMVVTATNADDGREGTEVSTVNAPTLNGSTYDLRLLAAQLIDYLRLCDSPILWHINEGNSSLLFTLKEPKDFEWRYIQTTLRLQG
jgi:DNA polymerase-3 subunit beta